MDFGSQACLVVLTEDGEYDNCDSELSSRYRETFSDPRFNPRWKEGTADHVRVVEV